MGPPEPTHQTAPWSVQLILRESQMFPTHHAMTDVAVGSIYALLTMCGPVVILLTRLRSKLCLWKRCLAIELPWCCIVEQPNTICSDDCYFSPVRGTSIVVSVSVCLHVCVHNYMLCLYVRSDVHGVAVCLVLLWYPKLKPKPSFFSPSLSVTET